MKQSPFLFVLLMIMAACSSIECPLNNTVSIQVVMAGETDTLKDTLNVYALRTDGTDTLLYNRGVNLASLSLPVSYQQDEDVLIFETTDTLQVVRRDTVRIAKTNQSHFESVDCSPAFFHTLTGVSHTAHAIDLIVINHAHVDYDATKQHLFIYYRAHD